MDRITGRRTKRACYLTNLTMASVFSLPPLLFAAFREMYGISYTLLGTLVLAYMKKFFKIKLVKA